MVTIRLARAGGKKRPFYHIVVTDSRKRRDSGYVERLGYFNPHPRGQDVRLHIDLERKPGVCRGLLYWLDTGAKMSHRVAALVQEFRKAA